MHPRPWIVLVVSTALLPAEGADVLPPLLPPVIVTASGLTEDPFDVAHRVDAFAPADIFRLAPRNLPDLLRETPGVLVQKTSPAQASPFIRGFTGYHNVLLIDGVRLNNAAFRAGPNQYWATVDPFGLSRVELVRGQGSVLHGSDAVGGVLNAFTRGPVYAEEGFLASARVAGRYATAEKSYQGRIEGSLGEAGKHGFYIGGTWKDFGDFRAAGLGSLPRTGFGEWGGDLKFERWLGPDRKLTVFHQQVRQEDAWRNHRTDASRSWEGTAAGDERVHAFDQDRSLTYVRLEGVLGAPLADDYRFTLSRHRQAEDRHRVREDGRFDEDGFTVDSYGARLEFTKDLEWTRLVHGVDYSQDRGSTQAARYNADGSLRERGIQGPFGDDAVYHLGGAYVNSITPLGAAFDLQAGLRYTYAAADIGRIQDPADGSPFSLTDSWHNVVGSARLVAKPSGGTRVFGGVSQAFRAPNFSDLSRLDVNRSSEIETPSPGLSPEQFLTYEVGGRVDRNRFRGEASWWITDIRSLIVRAPTGRIVDEQVEVTKRNSDGGYVQGLDFSGEFDLGDRVTLFGGFGWNDGVVQGFPTSAPVARDEPVSRLLPAQGFGGVRWQVLDRLSLEGLVFAADRQDRLSSSDRLDTQRIPPGGTPGYTTATFRALWSPTDTFRINAGVENAFNEAYRIHGSGQNEPGTNVVLGFEKTF